MYHEHEGVFAILRYDGFHGPDARPEVTMTVKQVDATVHYNERWIAPLVLENFTMNSRIAVNGEIHFGKPCVAGTRIPVQNVLELVREGLPFAKIIRDYYPDLTTEDIRACIQHAIDVVAVEDIHLAPTP
jgi:uncharacterized protein (DUF433 family)